MAVRIRMKRLGRKKRPFYRICAMDGRSPRDGKIIEELGYYDPMVRETDARAVLKHDRVDYWLSVGAQPSDKVAVLIKKYGSQGTRREAQQAAFDRLKLRPSAPEPVPVPMPKKELPSEPADEMAPADAAAESEAGGSEDASADA